MSAVLTRDQAREQVARAIGELEPTDPWPSPTYRWNMVADADAALSVLWPVVEGLRAELDHAHAVIARHVEPRREGEP